MTSVADWRSIQREVNVMIAQSQMNGSFWGREQHGEFGDRTRKADLTQPAVDTAKTQFQPFHVPKRCLGFGHPFITYFRAR